MFDEISEADESATDKPTALANLQHQVRTGETMGVIAMYEQAALDVGATPDEVKAAKTAARR